jgi:hypothetical protein
MHKLEKSAKTVQQILHSQETSILDYRGQENHITINAKIHSIVGKRTMGYTKGIVRATHIAFTGNKHLAIKYRNHGTKTHQKTI